MSRDLLALSIVVMAGAVITRKLTPDLVISSDYTRDNLTTNQDVPHMGLDGAGLSCPGAAQ